MNRAGGSVALTRSYRLLSGFIGFLVTASVVLYFDAQVHAQSGCTSGNTITYGGGNNDHIDPPGISRTVDMGGGEDLAEMADCSDVVFGRFGFDELHGAAGNDDVFGDGGNDQPSSCAGGRCGSLFGGSGTDEVEGGAGEDFLDDSQSGGDVDFLRGQENSDTLNADDGDSSDTLTGGGGTDSCNRDEDPPDSATCENVF